MSSPPTSSGNFSAAAVFSRGILRIPYLLEFLSEFDRVVTPFQRLRGCRFDAVVGWGHKPTAIEARTCAEKNNLPYLALEDGFIRSISPGVSGASPLSIVVDDLGIYYDATTSSRLERLLEVGGWESETILVRARKAIDLIVREKLSKYNHAPPLIGQLPGRLTEKVLVVDQTVGDASVINGMADADTFKEMLNAALAENPEAEIIVKTHPDVLFGKKRGYLTHAHKTSNRVHLMDKEVNPLSLIEKVDKVYTVTSQMGFEALLLGKSVECFGVPFYAGWGLTHDRQMVNRRTKRRTLDEVFAAAYILYPRYLNPFTNKPGTLEDVIAYLVLQVKHQRLLAGRRLLCTGLHWWKRPYLRKLLKVPGNQVVFGNRPESLDRVDKVVAWGDASDSVIIQVAEQTDIPILRMEDGFIRSMGLGSNLVRPLSLVFDSSGIYYDPTRPSDLETLLRETKFTPELCLQAKALLRRIVDERFSKYNVGDDLPLEVKADSGQYRILVPGQVEDDASIRLGCVDIRSNLELLAEVRSQNPAAYIIYKPHPDVLAGNRRGAVSEQVAMQHCDYVVTDRSMPACLDICDEVHTLTSLTGFEAILRGKTVVCYGLPFYAGWGLTQDRHELPRRGRHLTLEQLVAGVLILYPRYIDWPSGGIIPVEVALDRLGQDVILNSGRRNVESGIIRKWIMKTSGFFDTLR